MLAIAGLLAVAGCGDDDQAPAAAGGGAAMETQDDAGAAMATADATRRAGTRITLRRSEFGPMLFDGRRQAIYVFQNDRRNRSVCYGACARAWPPVFTRGRPRAGAGVKASLLGTVRRRGGRRQVTYAGRPLYFYAHERPGEVRCHNVDLNGGLWWAIGANGRPRP
jgi:predicted lipoprotein with Yx(FWY)xxD motif